MLVNSDLSFGAAQTFQGSVVTVRAKELTLNFQIAKEDEIIESLEGTLHANKGDYIMTGVEGERYVISQAKFPGKYKDIVIDNPETLEGHATKIVSDIPLAAFIVTSEGVQASTWNGVLTGNIGDLVVRYGENDFGIIAEHLIEKLYDFV